MLRDADFKIAPDTDYNHGAAGPSVPATSAQDCCAACLAYDGCAAGVFYGNACWLKTESDIAKPEAMPGRTACRSAPVAPVGHRHMLCVACCTLHCRTLHCLMLCATWRQRGPQDRARNRDRCASPRCTAPQLVCVRRLARACVRRLARACVRACVVMTSGAQAIFSQTCTARTRSPSRCARRDHAHTHPHARIAPCAMGSAAWAATTAQSWQRAAPHDNHAQPLLL